MKDIKIVKGNKSHREFLIKANLIIHNISQQSYESEFAKRLDADYFCSKPKFNCLVAECDNNAVGLILYSKMYWADDGEVLWVSQMYVDESYRKYGVALKLYSALKNFNPDANILSCATGKGNVKMNRILKGLGFNIIDMNFYAKKL